MEFQKIVEEVLQENTTHDTFKKPSRGLGVVSGLVTNTGKFYSSDHPHNGSWHGRSCEEDCTSSKPAQNKMGKHTRGNSLRAGKTSKGKGTKFSKKR